MCASALISGLATGMDLWQLRAAVEKHLHAMGKPALPQRGRHGPEVRQILLEIPGSLVWCQFLSLSFPTSERRLTSS